MRRPRPFGRWESDTSDLDFNHRRPDEFGDVKAPRGPLLLVAEREDLRHVLLKLVQGCGLGVGSRQAGENPDVEPGPPIPFDADGEALDHIHTLATGRDILKAPGESLVYSAREMYASRTAGFLGSGVWRHE